MTVDGEADAAAPAGDATLSEPQSPVEKRVDRGDRHRELELQRSLREGLQAAIVSDDPVEIESHMNRGASLQPHYYSSRVEATSRRKFPMNSGGYVHERGYFTAKGPKSGLVNPVDWAILNGNPRAALLILELGDGRVSFHRDEVGSFLGRIDLARQTRRAVNLAAKAGDCALLAALLERGGDVGQLSTLGESSLLVAVRAVQAGTTQMLLEAGAWSVEEKKQAVLGVAASNGLLDLFKFTSAPGSRPESRMARSEAASPPPRPATSMERLASPMAEAPTARPATSLGFDERTAGRAGGGLSREEFKQRLIRAVRRDQKGILHELVSGGDLGQLDFDLGFGEVGNVIDWTVVKGFTAKALELLELADALEQGRPLAQEAKAAFFWAIVQGHTEVLQALLARGCDISKRRMRHKVWSGGDSALDLAVFGSRGPEIRELLRHGAWDLESEERRANLMNWARIRPTVLEAFREAGLVEP